MDSVQHSVQQETESVTSMDFKTEDGIVENYCSKKQIEKPEETDAFIMISQPAAEMSRKTRDASTQTDFSESAYDKLLESLFSLYEHGMPRT